MANAILSALLDFIGTKDSPIRKVLACTKTLESGTRLQKIFANQGAKVEIIIDNNVRAAGLADIVLLGHKPHSLNVVLGQRGMANALEGKLVISILAGITEAQIRGVLIPARAGKPPHVIRVMPNIAAQIKQSTTVMSEPDPKSPTAMVNVTKWMFEKIGKVSIVPESMFGIATVLTGACIALTTVAIDGILDAAVIEGMTRPKAQELVSQCLLGTSMLLTEGMHPAVLRESISFPRGCTIQAVTQLERSNVRSAFTDAVLKGIDHEKGMGKNQD